MTRLSCGLHHHRGWHRGSSQSHFKTLMATILTCLAAVFIPRASQADDLDAAVQNLVKLAEGVGANPAQPQGAAASLAPAPSAVRTITTLATAPGAADAGVLFKDVWGADWDKENGFDLKFTPDNGAEDHGKVAIYIRRFDLGKEKRFVGTDRVDLGSWRSVATNSLIRVELTLRSNQVNVFELDPKKSVLIWVSGSLGLPARLVLARRVLGAEDFGHNGKQAFPR